MKEWPKNLAWCWTQARERYLVVINFSQETSQARVHLPWCDLRETEWHLQDRLSCEAYDRNGVELQDGGFYVDLEPLRFQILKFNRAL